jgi:hypothetical protein
MPDCGFLTFVNDLLKCAPRPESNTQRSTSGTAGPKMDLPQDQHTSDLEPVSGIEPLTCRLQDGCSAY